jgi:hypothetical protein
MIVSFTGTSAQPSTVTIATVLRDSGAVELDNSSLAAARVDVVPADLSAGSVASEGTSTLISPGLENHGDLTVTSGTLSLPDALPQLRKGILAGGTWAASGGQLVLPADVTHLAAGQLISGASASVTDPAGHNALTGLTSIGAGGSLQIAGGSLSLTGDLTSAGTIGIGNSTTGARASLTVAGTLTQKRSPTFGSLAVLGTLGARTVLIDRCRGTDDPHRDARREPGQRRHRRRRRRQRHHIRELHPGQRRHPGCRVRPRAQGRGQGHAGRRAGRGARGPVAHSGHP